MFKYGYVPETIRTYGGGKLSRANLGTLISKRVEFKECPDVAACFHRSPESKSIMTRNAPPGPGSASGSVTPLRTGDLIEFCRGSNGSNAAAIDARTDPDAPGRTAPRRPRIPLGKPDNGTQRDTPGHALTDCGSEGRGFESRRSPSTTSTCPVARISTTIFVGPGADDQTAAGCTREAALASRFTAVPCRLSAKFILATVGPVNAPHRVSMALYGRGSGCIPARKGRYI
jgi:hypothetical protein